MTPAMRLALPDVELIPSKAEIVFVLIGTPSAGKPARSSTRIHGCSLRAT